MDMKAVGLRIKSIRGAQLLKQQDLAVRAGLGVAHISRIEHGQKQAAFVTIAKIAEALEVSLDTLAGREVHHDAGEYPPRDLSGSHGIAF